VTVDSRAALLVAELRADWAMVERHRDKAISVDPGANEGQAALVALSIDHAYQAFEALLLRHAHIVGLAVDREERWHQQVLAQAALDIPEVRPALVPPSARAHWQIALGFRHFLRHAYAADLEPDELRRTAARLDMAVRESTSTILAAISALVPPT
jgi:hypothetical protein